MTFVPDQAQCVTTGTGMRYDPETETLVPQPMGFYPTGGTHGVSPTEDGIPSLKVGTGSGGDAPPVLMTMREGKPGGGKGPLLSEDESLTLATGNSQVLFDPVPIQNAAIRTDSSAKTPSPDVEGRVRLRDPGLGVGEPGDPSYTLDATHPHAVGPVPMQPMAVSNRQGEPTLDRVSPTLKSGGDLALGGHGQALVTAYGVRRLTPVECERLQSFPDQWTEPAGSDSARYKALGNAVTVNVPQWLFGRMLKVHP